MGHTTDARRASDNSLRRAPRRLAATAAAAAMALASALTPSGAQAQDAWIQIEAKRSLAEAESAARRHGARVPSVAGFTAAGGWYVVAVGPFARAEAQARLARLRAEALVPGDAFLTEGDLYRAPFWPAGAALAGAPSPAAADPAPAPLPAAQPAPPAGGESVEVARQAEDALDAGAREEIQHALEWAGVYEGDIDGAFGRGTRDAMAAWQGARGEVATGILTTAQRTALLSEFNAVFDGLGMARIEDAPAGVSVEMPTARLALAAHETPFARYDATDGSAALVLLISQAGDARTLAGLYEALQTLDAVPREGRREIEEGERFSITGRDARVETRAFARLQDGEIKGLVLVWPAGDEVLRARLWEWMRASFEARPGAVLGPAHATLASAQRLDRLAGLSIRQPVLSRSGVFIDAGGAVLTTAEVAGGACGVVLIDDAHEAEVAWSDEHVALLRPLDALAPPRVGVLAQAPEPIGAPVAVAGFPFGGALGQASLTRGRLDDLRGLGGEGALDRYAMSLEPGDAGGPVLTQTGAVAGLLLPGGGEGGDGRRLPGGVAFGVDAGRLGEVLREAGVEPAAPVLASGGAALTPERLAREAAEMAVLVTCHG